MSTKTFPFLGIDVDRDAPFPHSGVKHAVSLPLKHLIKDKMNPEHCFTYEATISGLEVLIQLIKAYPIPTVFFFEGRALEQFRDTEKNLLKRIADLPFASYGVHGYDHEDLLGQDSGIPLTKDEQLQIFTFSKTCLENILNRSADGFRAPYTRISSSSLTLIEKLGFKFDSSFYSCTNTIPSPYRIGSLWEIPIIQIPRGPTFYLWTLFEGTRSWQDYLTLLNSIIDQENVSVAKHLGIIPLLWSLNFHPWHLSYSVRKRRYLRDSEIEQNVTILQHTIEFIVTHCSLRLESVSKLLSI